jgi:23S rRNA (adenine2503-C2)-methyltransferase
MNLYNLTLNEIEQQIKKVGLPKYKAKQVFLSMYRDAVPSLSDISTLSKKDRAILAESYNLDCPAISIIRGQGSKKFLLTLDDGAKVEMVTLNERDGVTLCLSSQVGCAMGCTFCYTAKMGLTRNLTTSEIVSQYILAKREGLDVKHIVFMGMGEPLHNVESVLKAVSILNDESGANVGARRFTISTCGVIPGIKALKRAGLAVGLAISLNASSDADRSRMMPVNSKYPLSELILEATRYMQETKRRVSFEYVLIKGKTDRRDDVERLANMLARKGFHLNLIPYNGTEFGRPENNKVEWFKSA